MLLQAKMIGKLWIKSHFRQSKISISDAIIIDQFNPLAPCHIKWPTEEGKFGGKKKLFSLFECTYLILCSKYVKHVQNIAYWKTLKICWQWWPWFLCKASGVVKSFAKGIPKAFFDINSFPFRSRVTTLAHKTKSSKMILGYLDFWPLFKVNGSRSLEGRGDKLMRVKQN